MGLRFLNLFMVWCWFRIVARSQYKAAWYQQNKTRMDALHREWLKLNPEKRKETCRKYSIKNRDRIQEIGKEWRKNNKERYLFRIRNYVRNRTKTDIQFRIKMNCRARIWHALTGSKKAGRTAHLLGCSIPELKTHLEKQFLPGMSWDNYGDWHIDHKRPCVSFDLRDPLQQKECFNYVNLQPLWARDNLVKGGKFPSATH